MIQTNNDWAVSNAAGCASVAGWVFSDTSDGQQPFSLRARYNNGTNILDATLGPRYMALLRDDVAAAFAGQLPKLNRFVGFQIELSGMPAGWRTITLEWANSNEAKYSSIDVDVR